MVRIRILSKKNINSLTQKIPYRRMPIGIRIIGMPKKLLPIVMGHPCDTLYIFTCFHRNVHNIRSAISALFTTSAIPITISIISVLISVISVPISAISVPISVISVPIFAMSAISAIFAIPEISIISTLSTC